VLEILPSRVRVASKAPHATPTVTEIKRPLRPVQDVRVVVIRLPSEYPNRSMTTQNVFRSAADGTIAASKPSMRYSNLPPCQLTSCFGPQNPPILAISLVGPNTVLTLGMGLLRETSACSLPDEPGEGDVSAGRRNPFASVADLWSFQKYGDA